MDRIKQLRQRKTDLVTEAEALAANDADGKMTEDEGKRYAAILDVDLPAANESIKREERLMEERRSIPASETAPATVPATAKPDPKKFVSFGEQLQAVARAGMNRSAAHAEIHPGLVYQSAGFQATGTGLNESIPSEGGFLVQQDYSTQLLEAMHEMGLILSRVRRIPIGAQSNGIKLPAIDETSRANGSRFGGVQAYWADEADTVAASKPKFRQMELSLKKLMAIGYVTDELLADTSALESVLTQAFTEELTFKTEDAILNGTGAGQPLGILNSGAVVTVTPESAQPATALRAQNILDMWSRVPVRNRKNAVWMINQDVEQQLHQLTIGSGVAVQMMYALPGSRSNDTELGQLMGRPVIPVEYAATLGTVGDLILWDPQAYVMIDKNGVKQASSMHVRFLYEEMTFRFTFRVDGQPIWRTPLTPFKGTNTLSPYVVLGTR